MFLGFWTFLKGYVAVEVTGASVERFLNMAAHRGIYVWDVTKLSEPGRHGIRMHCSIQGFRLLRDCAKKTKCRMKIARREGIPFVMHRYRRRKVLMGGIAFFVVFLYVMSSFVWLIDVEGNERISSAEILEFSGRSGLRIGAFKHFIDHRELARQLIFEFEDVGWANVHTRGTRTLITISETIPAVPELTGIPRHIPCDIVAARDGLITSIVTAAGMPKVRQHDVVRQGDVLVSGTLLIESDDAARTGTIFVHAYAEVWARMYTPIQFVIPMSYIHKSYTGAERRHHSLQWLLGGQGNINLPHGRIPFDNYDKIVSHIQPGASGSYPIPFILTTATYREFVPETHQRTVESAMALADRIITERIIREFDFHADIIDKQILYEEQPDQLIVRALITTNERIDKAVPLDPVLFEGNIGGIDGTEDTTDTG